MPGRIHIRVTKSSIDRVVTGQLMRPGTDVDREAKRYADRVAGEAQTISPRVTGEFARSWQVERGDLRMRPGLGRALWRVVNTSDHAVFVEKGTRPHAIARSAPKGALRFVGSSGQTVFRRQVSHPGTRAQNVLAEAARRVTGKRLVVRT